MGLADLKVRHDIRKWHPFGGLSDCVIISAFNRNNQNLLDPQTLGVAELQRLERDLRYSSWHCPECLMSLLSGPEDQCQAGGQQEQHAERGQGPPSLKRGLQLAWGLERYYWCHQSKHCF